jgi:uncharacterized protein YuzE
MLPELTYDPDADAVYVTLAEGLAHEGAEVAPGVVLDLDREGRLLGIEITNAKATLAPGRWSQARPPSAGSRHAAE